MYRLILIAILFITSNVFAQTNTNHVKVNGYYRKDGTYVAPHYRTAPNSTNRDNFSTKGNINPYTGKKGTVDPDNKQSGGYYYPTYSHSTYYPSRNVFHSEGYIYLSGCLGNSFENSSPILAYGFSIGYYKYPYKIGFVLDLYSDEETNNINVDVGILYPTRLFVYTVAIGFGEKTTNSFWGDDDYKLNVSLGIDICLGSKVSIPIRYQTNGNMILGGLAYHLFL